MLRKHLQSAQDILTGNAAMQCKEGCAHHCPHCAAAQMRRAFRSSQEGTPEGCSQQSFCCTVSRSCLCGSASTGSKAASCGLLSKTKP